MSRPEPDGNVVYADLLAYVLTLALNAWFLMLLFGVLHGSADWMPAFGWWQSLFAAFVLTRFTELGTAPILNRVKKLTPTYGKKTTTGNVQIDGKALAEALLLYGKKGQS